MKDKAFKEFCKVYPKKEGTRIAKVIFMKEIRSLDMFKVLLKAVDNYKDKLAKEKVDYMYIKNIDTFMLDYMDYESPLDETKLKTSVDKLLESV